MKLIFTLQVCLVYAISAFLIMDFGASLPKVELRVPFQVKVVQGAKPTQANLAAWMDKLIAKAASPGMDGAVTYEIMSFQLGSPRKWQYNDGGNPANGHNTTVYPVKVRFVQKTHYRTRTHVIDRQCVFTSFKDSFGSWTFGYSSVPHIDKTYDEPADM